MKTGIFYGSTTGLTAKIAKEIAAALGVDEKDVHNVATTSPATLGDYELLVLGSSTWGDGEVQPDWYDFLDGARALALDGKKIALFGEGDETMDHTFCAAMARIKDELKDSGATFIGEFDAAPYSFADSASKTADGLMVGLALDNVNHADLTPGRIQRWVKTLN